jgi:hypothetical protein
MSPRIIKSKRQSSGLVRLAVIILIAAGFLLTNSFNKENSLTAGQRALTGQGRRFRTGLSFLKLEKAGLSIYSEPGQLDSRVNYYLAGKEKNIYFTAGGLTISLSQFDPAVESYLAPSGLGDRQSGLIFWKRMLSQPPVWPLTRLQLFPF